MKRSLFTCSYCYLHSLVCKYQLVNSEVRTKRQKTVTVHLNAYKFIYSLLFSLSISLVSLSLHSRETYQRTFLFFLQSSLLLSQPRFTLSTLFSSEELREFLPFLLILLFLCVYVGASCFLMIATIGFVWLVLKRGKIASFMLWMNEILFFFFCF